MAVPTPRQKEHPFISLMELNNRVKAEMKHSFADSLWVIAEISEININYSGHCYLELVEKNQDSGQITARAKATIWAFTFRILKPYFESVAAQPLAAGLKIMVQASVEFHEVYGYSLNIKDIEPGFTLGDVARKRQEIINKLKAEGVFHLNKEIEFPLVPQRIAVISSSTAAGYGDFINQVANNRYGFKFAITLFQAFMQGTEAEQSIIDALEKIFQTGDLFDVVVIIRGGGSQADLDCFNSYWLCYHITQFPIAVITGIGHERDETIADLVAHTNLKTPTAVAEFLISQVADFNDSLSEAQAQMIALSFAQIKTVKDTMGKLSHSIVTLVNMRMLAEQQRIAAMNQSARRSFAVYVQQHTVRIRNLQQNLKLHLQHLLMQQMQSYTLIQRNFLNHLQQFLKQEKRTLDQHGNSLHLLDPAKILKRGYSITFVKGKLIKSITQVKPGDQIESIWVDGSASSSVNEIKPSATHE